MKVRVVTKDDKFYPQRFALWRWNNYRELNHPYSDVVFDNLEDAIAYCQQQVEQVAQEKIPPKVVWHN